MRVEVKLLAILILGTLSACAPPRAGSGENLEFSSEASSGLAAQTASPAPAPAPAPTNKPATAVAPSGPPAEENSIPEIVVVGRRSTVNAKPTDKPVSSNNKPATVPAPAPAPAPVSVNTKPNSPPAPQPPAAKPPEKPANKPNDSTFTSVNQPAPAPKPADKPADKPAEKPPAKPADKPAPVVKPTPKAEPDHSSDDNDDDEYTDIDALWDKKAKAAAWTGITVRALDKLGNGMINIVPDDIGYYCPRYAKLDRDHRIAFYVQMISALASVESSFRTEDKYTESFNDSSGTRVVSRGLLALSVEESNGYGCQIESGSELQTAVRNLRCGVRILNKWISLDHVIKGGKLKINKAKGEQHNWRGAARVWSTFRSDNHRHFIQKATNSLEFCKPLPKKKKSSD